MPPKVKITKEEIVEAAMRIVREQGEEALNARNIAASLGCSTQPIFSNFATMAELRLAVIAKADALYEAYVQKEVESGLYPAFKASGMAYIRFAREEKQLFRLLYMRDRSNENQAETTQGYDRMLSVVQGSTGLDSATAKLFHLESWAFVHGIATMFATGYLDLDWELVSDMLTDAYMGLRKRYEEKE